MVEELPDGPAARAIGGVELGILQAVDGNAAIPQIALARRVSIAARVASGGIANFPIGN
jgi:hypothetical protein